MHTDDILSVGKACVCGVLRPTVCKEKRGCARIGVSMCCKRERKLEGGEEGDKGGEGD